MPKKLSSHLEENLAVLNDMFGTSGDFYAKRIAIDGVSAAIVLFDNLAGL